VGPSPSIAADRARGWTLLGGAALTLALYGALAAALVAWLGPSTLRDDGFAAPRAPEMIRALAATTTGLVLLLASSTARRRVRALRVTGAAAIATALLVAALLPGPLRSLHEAPQARASAAQLALLGLTQLALLAWVARRSVRALRSH
jgi:hypothetical protein